MALWVPCYCNVQSTREEESEDPLARCINGRALIGGSTSASDQRVGDGRELTKNLPFGLVRVSLRSLDSVPFQSIGSLLKDGRRDNTAVANVFGAYPKEAIQHSRLYKAGVYLGSLSSIIHLAFSNCQSNLEPVLYSRTFQSRRVRNTRSYVHMVTALAGAALNRLVRPISRNPYNSNMMLT